MQRYKNREVPPLPGVRKKNVATPLCREVWREGRTPSLQDVYADAFFPPLPRRLGGGAESARAAGFGVGGAPAAAPASNDFR